jgi:hypothetical protein
VARAPWETFIRKLLSYRVEHHGIKEVRRCFSEVWNEPNLKKFCSGEQADYFKLTVTQSSLKKLLAFSFIAQSPAWLRSARATPLWAFSIFGNSMHYPRNLGLNEYASLSAFFTIYTVLVTVQAFIPNRRDTRFVGLEFK